MSIYQTVLRAFCQMIRHHFCQVFDKLEREVSIQIPGTAFRGVLAVFELHSQNLVGMELLDHFQSLQGQTCKFWPLRGQNGVK